MSVMNVVTRLAALIVAAALLLPATAAAQGTVEHTLAVTGHGEVELQPDRGSFTTEVRRLSRTADAARSRASRGAKAIAAGLRGLGVARNAISTSQIRIGRQKFRRRKDGPVLTRFQATVGLRIAVDDVDLLGRAIDVASGRGATQVFGPRLSFSPSLRDDGALRAEAAALSDARARAEAAAAAEGQQVVGVQAIDLDPEDDGASTFGAFAPSADSTAGAGGSVSTPVFTGTRKVTSEVRVAYLIAPAA